VAEACDCVNEPLGSINFGQILDLLKTCCLLRKYSSLWRFYEKEEEKS
jgi:hypothetical protein